MAEIEDVEFANHWTKCRFCLRSFDSKGKQAGITREMENKFLKMTQIELKTSTKFSTKICIKCDSDFTSCYNYWDQISNIQTRLYKYSAKDQQIQSFSQMTNKDEFDVKTEQIVVKCEPPILEENIDVLDVIPKNSSALQDYVKTEKSTDESMSELEEVMSEKVIKKRVRRKKSELKWSCIYCEKYESLKTGFKILKQLEEHILSKHTTATPAYSCKNCEKVYLLQSRLNAHSRTHNEDQNAICSFCGFISASKFQLKRHIAVMHLKQKKFFCDLCPYGAVLKKYLRSHMQKHMNLDDRRIHECQHCMKVFTSTNSLRIHIVNEHSGNVFQCIPCQKIFHQKGGLFLHIKGVHKKIKDHVCNDCGKSFFNKPDLRDHIKQTHFSNIRTIKCEICGKMFCTRKQLFRHKVIHTEASFRCTVKGCDKVYKKKTLLKSHMKMHEGKRDKMCHLCDKSYFFSKDLHVHLNVAHKAKTYFCELCPFTNSRKDYLGNHLKSAHQLTDDERKLILGRAKVVKTPV